jgi:hypothetical protein
MQTFWGIRERENRDAVVLRAKPFRGLTFSPFQEGEDVGPSEIWTSEAYDRLVLRQWHGACVQVFAGARDVGEVDERLELLVSAHAGLVPHTPDGPVERIRERFFGEDPDLMERYLRTIENPKTSPTVSERSEREWMARRIREWLVRPSSNRASLALLVGKLVRTSLPMGSAVPEMPKFLCGWDGWPHVCFREIGTLLKHSCRPNTRWTCLDAELVVRADEFVPQPWTANLVPHLDSRRTFESDTWKRVAAIAFSDQELPRETDELVCGRGHREMIESIHGLECDCDGTSLRQEAKLAAEETWFELERRCGQCGKWSAQTLLRCSVCKFQRYCGVTCQRRHWSTHRVRCSIAFDREEFRERLYRAALTLSQKQVVATKRDKK